MLYDLAHVLKEKCPWIWDLIEWTNDMLMRVLHGRQLKSLAAVLEKRDFYYATEADASRLAAFFSDQPEEAYTYFRPHGFDEASLRKLLKRKSWVLYFREDNDGNVVAYGFLRCFFMGKAYLGKMVSTYAQGKGHGHAICLAGMDVALHLGLHMYESISKKNLASMRSTEKVLMVRVVAELEDDTLLLEDTPLPLNESTQK